MGAVEALKRSRAQSWPGKLSDEPGLESPPGQKILEHLESVAGPASFGLSVSMLPKLLRDAQIAMALRSFLKMQDIGPFLSKSANVAQDIGSFAAEQAGINP